MEVSIAVLTPLKGEAVKIFKEDLNKSQINFEIIKEGREILRKLVKQRIEEKK